MARKLTQAEIDCLVRGKSLHEILRAAATIDLSEINIDWSTPTLNEELFLRDTVPTECARHAIEQMTGEPDAETKALLFEVARKNVSLREPALAKLGLLHRLEDDPYWPDTEDLSL